MDVILINLFVEFVLTVNFLNKSKDSGKREIEDVSNDVSHDPIGKKYGE